MKSRFVTLRVAFDLAYERAERDATRGLSRERAFLQDHYNAVAATLRDVPSTDLVIDTGVVGVSDAAQAVAKWACGTTAGDRLSRLRSTREATEFSS